MSVLKYSCFNKLNCELLISIAYTQFAINVDPSNKSRVFFYTWWCVAKSRPVTNRQRPVGSSLNLSKLAFQLPFTRKKIVFYPLSGKWTAIGMQPRLRVFTTHLLLEVSRGPCLCNPGYGSSKLCVFHQHIHQHQHQHPPLTSTLQLRC